MPPFCMPKTCFVSRFCPVCLMMMMKMMMLLMMMMLMICHGLNSFEYILRCNNMCKKKKS